MDLLLRHKRRQHIMETSATVVRVLTTPTAYMQPCGTAALIAGAGLTTCTRALFTWRLRVHKKALKTQQRRPASSKAGWHVAMLLACNAARQRKLLSKHRMSLSVSDTGPVARPELPGLGGMAGHAYELSVFILGHWLLNSEIVCSNATAVFDTPSGDIWKHKEKRYDGITAHCQL